MSRGKKAFIDEPIHKKLSLPGSLVLEIEDILRDPVRGKVRYGAFADLVTSLLRKWVYELRARKEKEKHE